ncbi:hypothetical protein GCM10017710_31310 [Arthrobacter ramosus]
MERPYDPDAAQLPPVQVAQNTGGTKGHHGRENRSCLLHMPRSGPGVSMESGSNPVFAAQEWLDSVEPF